jgi:acetyl-CoA synthetase (ADP-forming)
MRCCRLQDKSNQLDYFFYPQSVAIIGASSRFMSWGYMLIKNASKSGFKGKIYPINPNAPLELFGMKVYRRLVDVPEKVDLAVIAVPSKYCVQVVEECGDVGVKAAVVCTAGFSEIGEEGRKLEDELVKAAQARCIRLIGPNCNGIYNLEVNLVVSALSKKIALNTPTVLITQSGYIGYTLAYWGHQQKMGFGKYVSIGNQCDVTITELLEYFGNDPTVKTIMIYLEGLKDGQRFIEVAKHVSLKKPIIVFKAGKTDQGFRAAASHSGSIAGSIEIQDAAFRQAGVIQTFRVEDMLTLATAFNEHPPIEGDRIGIVTMGGGWGVTIVDALVENGLKVPEFSDELKVRIRKYVSQLVAVKNPVDIGADWPLTPDSIFKVTETIIADKDIDVLITHSVTYTDFSEVVSDGEDAPETLRQWKREEAKLLEDIWMLEKKYKKPIFNCTLLSERQSEPIRAVEKKGMRVYRNINQVAFIIKAMLSYRKTLEKAGLASGN